MLTLNPHGCPHQGLLAVDGINTKLAEDGLASFHKELLVATQAALEEDVRAGLAGSPARIRNKPAHRVTALLASLLQSATG